MQRLIEQIVDEPKEYDRFHALQAPPCRQEASHIKMSLLSF
jgi:hypothetical protein